MTAASLYRFVATAFLAVALEFAGPVRADDSSVFGQSSSEAALTGIFYDLKQTQDRRPTNLDTRAYWGVLDEFMSRKWDETVLNHFYRSSRPLYTTQIYIPNMNANLAPKAFGEGKNVKPSRWVIHYKAQVSPPNDGTYRFVGGSDDVIAVAVNGRTVLVSPLRLQPKEVMPKTNWSSPEPMQGAEFSMCNGDWIDLKADEIVDLDVIIGERPGGNFNAFLMIQKQGETYEKNARRLPILPIFQVAAYDTPRSPNPEHAPAFAKGFPPWRSHQ